jgi:hypothetical protein
MRIVLVVGAGASVSQAEGNRSVSADRLPPLDSTFFRRMGDLKIKVGRELTDYATDLLGQNPFLQSEVGPKPGMEEFFRDLFYDFVSNDADERAHAAYRQLVNAYVTVLRRTTNPIAAAGVRGPLSRILQAASRRSTHLSIVTFNHDLILENVIAASGSLRGRWCLKHGYGVFGRGKTYTLSDDADGFPNPANCRHTNPVLLHKLHGSLNWYLLAEKDEDRAVLRGEPTADARIRITRRRQIPQRLRWSGRPVRPVVVPPVYAKQPFLEGLMGPVWREARDNLTMADRVVFLGYSLPPADIEAEKLFQRALRHNESSRWIDLVNPDPGAAGRYASALPHVPLRRYETIQQFLASGGKFAEEPS